MHVTTNDAAASLRRSSPAGLSDAQYKSLACAVNEKGRPVITDASHVTVVAPWQKCACRCVTSRASSEAVGQRRRLQELLHVDLAGTKAAPGAEGLDRGERRRAHHAAAAGASAGDPTLGANAPECRASQRQSGIADTEPAAGRYSGRASISSTMAWRIDSSDRLMT